MKASQLSPEEARFDCLEWALQYAFLAEAKQIGPDSLRILSPKDDGGATDFQLFYRRLTNGLPANEIIADGLMLKNMILREVDRRGSSWHRWVLCSKYRVSADPHLQYCKEMDYRLLSRKIKHENPRIPDKWLIVDIIRGWAEGTARMHKSYEEWARKIGTSDKSIYRWAGSREPGYKSVKFLLNIWLDEAQYIVREKLIQDGQLDY